jgi:hypothetical protein
MFVKKTVKHIHFLMPIRLTCSNCSFVYLIWLFSAIIHQDDGTGKLVCYALKWLELLIISIV